MAGRQAEALLLFQKVLEKPETPQGMRLEVKRLVRNCERALEKDEKISYVSHRANA